MATLIRRIHSLSLPNGSRKIKSVVLKKILHTHTLTAAVNFGIKVLIVSFKQNYLPSEGELGEMVCLPR